ncbi:MAG: hypothetical protein WBM83_04040 [Flavobacteriaceae bacterium]
MRTFMMYNIYIMVSISFYFYWYHTIIEDRKGKMAIKVLAAVFLLYGLFSLMKWDGAGLQKYTFMVGAVFTLICALLHFRQLLQSDDALNLSRTLPFWVSTGLLLFNIGMVPYMLLSDYLNFRNNIYSIVILLLLNFILYGCFSIGFIWSREKPNRF